MQPARTREPFCTPGARLGGDALAPCEATIDRFLWLDVLQQRGISVGQGQESHCGLQEGVGHGRWAG